MRRKFLIGALSFLALIFVLVIAVFIYIRSGRLDLWLQDQIVTGLADVGIRAEIGSTRLDIRGYKVTLQDVKLYPGEGVKPFASIEQIVAEFSVVDYLRQKINITAITVSRPDAWIEIDEQGRSNLDALRSPPESEEKEARIKFLTANITVDNGQIKFVDRARNIEAQAPDFSASFNPLEPAALEDKINHRLQFSFNKPATAIYEGRQIENIDVKLGSHVTDAGAEIDQFNINSDLGQLTATGKVLSFEPLKYDFDVKTNAALSEIARVFAPDTRMNGGAVFEGKVEGTGADYRARGSLAADSITAAGFQIANVRVSTNVSGSGASYDATADVSTGQVRGRDLSIASIRLSNATVKGRDSQFDVSAGLALGSLKSGSIAVNGLRGNLDVDPQRATLSQFSASALGGSVSGTASVAYSGGLSSVDVSFKSIDLNQAASLAATKAATVRGSANGTARLTFPGLNYEAATGRANATFDAAVSPSEPGAEALPARGRISLVADGRGFNIEEAVVRSASSQATVTGRVTLNGAASLAVNLNSDDMAEVQRAIEAFGLIPADVQEEYQLALAGAGEFKGRVEGRLSAPSVSGHLSLEKVQSRDEALGSFEADVGFTPSSFNIENASLVRPDQSRADFSVKGPIGGEKKNAISLNANLQSLDLAAFVRVAAPGFADFVSGGVVNGKIDLRGLPGPRGIEGTANITISNAEFNVPSAEEGKEAEKFSVPEFAGQVNIANSVLNVQGLRMQVGGSAITGEGTFNLDTYAYSVNAQGKGIDLARLSDALPGNVRLGGQADLTITGQGDWDEWSTSNLNATIQGENVTVNGRDLGNAKIAAFTDNGLLKIEATGNVLDQPRTLAATIDLRDRKNYPVSASVEFNDEDLGQYLSLIAPELSSISARATGTIKLSGPLQEPDQIQAVANLSKLEFGGTVNEGRRYTITNQGDVVITATPKQITIEPVKFVGEGTSVNIEGALVRGEELRSNLRVDGEINLRLISSFTPIVTTTGIAQVQASITGSLDSPRLLGSVDLRDVGLRVVDFPLSIANGQGQVRFTANQALIENFTASTPGGGSVVVSGGAALSGLVPDRWRIEANLDQVGIEYPRDTQTVVDAQMMLQGNRRVQVLSGDVEVRRAAYTRDTTLDDLLKSGGIFAPDLFEAGPGGGGGPGGGPAITLDIHVRADNTLIVRNNLADAVGSAFLNIRGRIDDPVIAGRVLLSRGTLEFRNDRYDLTRGVITLPGRRGAEPVLDIQSEAEIRGYSITISFTGPPSKLQTTLKSDPDLPEADIISLVLTGNLATDQTTAATATQTGLGLAQSLLTASLLSEFEKGTQRLFGLSRFSIDPLLVGRGNDPTARITIGQRVTKNLTLTYSQNLTSGPSGIDRIVLVEYRLSNRFSVVGFRNERGELGFDVRVRKRF